MSQDRFRHLEFEQAEAPPSEAASSGRDQHSYLLEATRAYLEGDYEPALKHYSSALKFDKTLHEAWAGQVRCLVKLGELREAKTWAEKACGLFPEVPILESARGLALVSAGLLQEGLAGSDKALEQAEKVGLTDANLWLERGICLLTARQAQTAEHCFGKALEIAPDDPDWAQRVAVEWLAASQPARALALLNNVVGQRPNRAYGWLLQAQALRRLGLRDQALQALARADSLRMNWTAADDERRLLKRNCWIATLVFAHEDHPVVKVLRGWRDECWMKHPLGRGMSWAYDRTAPRVCLHLSQCPWLQEWLRWSLTALARRLPATSEGRE